MRGEWRMAIQIRISNAEKGRICAISLFLFLFLTPLTLHLVRSVLIKPLKIVCAIANLESNCDDGGTIEE